MDDKDSRLGRIEGKIDIIVNQHYDRMNRIDENIEDTNRRISSVEKKIYTICGSMGVIGVILGALAKWVFGKI